MARILGVDIPNDKQVQYSLTYIYGVGLKTAQNACAAAGVEPTIRVKNLTEEQITAIRNELAQVKTEGELRREIALNIKRLQEIGCYRGIRHRRGLPCRGQGTKNNARTCKGPRKTIANKKVATR